MLQESIGKCFQQITKYILIFTCVYIYIYVLDAFDLLH